MSTSVPVWMNIKAMMCGIDWTKLHSVCTSDGLLEYGDSLQSLMATWFERQIQGSMYILPWETSSLKKYSNYSLQQNTIWIHPIVQICRIRSFQDYRQEGIKKCNHTQFVTLWLCKLHTWKKKNLSSWLDIDIQTLGMLPHFICLLPKRRN